ncbi:GNAT family N-acetyltransferase [Methanobrevibacter curvatus]|uniref:Acetyltransferase (GNAT) family protein n=1 Tax=Methanobrevibacter curvatus TaxID=49547 RepID=A0A166AW74_9EURY|nr:GNAT family N-acetyltransferase [Methanobrevibacter curvatus]KZX12544.1 acetyltransferase (GNAT) family protein [Methanobrevibacter curvatus]
MKILNAEVDDLEEILELQKLSFVSEALIHDDFNIKPLHQTMKEIIHDFNTGTILKISDPDSDKIIGSVRGYKKDEKFLIEKLFVHPDYQNKGIAKKLLEKIENVSGSRVFELYTSHKSIKNLSLYRKLGYVKFKIEKVHDEFYFIHLRKVIQ